MKKCIVLLLLFLLAFSSVFAEASDNTFLDEIFLSDIPITYGDEAFRARILEKTKGERDPIGLVLTGGSARACAHIGVLKYLEEQGIIPDFIVSNSMGSIIGMLYAAGLKAEQIEEVLLAADLSTLFSFTFPIDGGILVPTGFRTMIESLVGADFNLEDTDIPVMVVNDDLITKREVRITEGNFTDILIGSFALPVYFAPFEYKGHLLVDGGVISLAPLDAAYEYSDTIILSSTFYDQEDMELINPVTVLNASFDIGKRQNIAKDMKKYKNFIWIRCAVENYSFMAFNKAIDIAKIGYSSAALASDELSTLYKAGEVSDSMKKTREEIFPKISKINKSLTYFDRIEAADPTLMLAINVKNMNFEGKSDYYLKQSAVLGLDYSFLYGPAEMGVGSGIGFDTSDLCDSTVFWSFNSYIGYYPFDNFRMTGEIYIDMFRKNASFMPTIYFREGIDYIPFSIDRHKISLNQTMEYYNDYADKEKGSSSLFSSSIKYNGDFGFGDLYASVGYLLTATSIIWEEPANFLQASALLRSYCDSKNSIYIDTRALSRISLDKAGRVPLFFSDEYTTSTIDYGSRQIYTNAKYHNTIVGVEFGYDLPHSFTFGEFVTIEDSEAGMYFDMLIQDKAVGFSTGLDLQTKISMIGLVNIPFRIKIGYEYTVEKKHAFVSSLAFSLKY